MQIHAVSSLLEAVEATLHSRGHKKIQCTEEGARSLEKLYDPLTLLFFIYLVPLDIAH